ncbi:hypothetical protein [Carboxylicivirga marina]|uniref:hypothetical protein n=1 Tax=Carboxylicivirga marina TaxID=2800988 RepID=UPI002591A56E|nr:hypothetical protein [uncultured Carboxylicivirga sp.]
MKTINIIALCILIVGIISCDRPQCTNENPIFEKNQPNSKIYKDELVKQLKTIDQSKLTYWLQKYEEKNGQEYLYFHIQGDGLCAKIVLTMNQWNKLENVRAMKGVSYRGAEFTNLNFDIRQDTIATDFIYKSFDSIID